MQYGLRGSKSGARGDNMSKLIYFMGVSVGSWLGWGLAEIMGGGLMTAYSVSVLGSIVGLFAALKICSAYLP